MSIYSGFATRNQQKYYDKALYNVISTLMVRVVKFYKNESIDEKSFRKIIKDQHKLIMKLESHKYAEPKYTDLFQHFMKVLDKKQRQKQDHHLNFELRRKSIDNNETLNRSLSALERQMSELQNCTDKIETLKFIDDLSSENGLKLIPQRKKSQSTKKKQKKNRSSSMKSGIDVWDVKNQKLPDIVSNVNPVSQAILARTRFHNFSQKLTNKTIDMFNFDQNPSNQSILQRPNKFRAKVMFK